MIGLFLGGLVKRLIDAATALLGIVRQYPWQCAVIALVALSALLWRGKTNAIDERDAARAETAALATNYRNAQDKAEAAQIAANTANVQTQIERNKGITNAHAINQTAARNAVADYKRLHPANRCSPGNAASPGMHPDPGAPAGNGDLAGLLTITERNFDLSSAAALRGAECAGFLRALVVEGLGKAD